MAKSGYRKQTSAVKPAAEYPADDVRS